VNINATVDKNAIRLPNIARIAGMPLVLMIVKPMPADNMIDPVNKNNIQ
jgi:hypothetical protein